MNSKNYNKLVFLWAVVFVFAFGTAGAMAATTPNLALEKIPYATTNWHLNEWANMDKIDTALGSEHDTDGTHKTIRADDIITGQGPRIDVRAYGAVGNGATNDTVAIQAAIDAAAGDVPVFLPPGEYYITSALELPDFTTLVGSGLSTILKCDSDGIKKDSADDVGTYLTIKDMRITNTDHSGSNSERGIDFTAVTHSLVENVRIEFFHTGIYLSRGPSAEACWFNHVTETGMYYTKIGIDLDDGVAASPNNNIFDNIHMIDVGVWSDRTGIEIAGYGHQFTDIYLGMTAGFAGVNFTTELYSYSVAGNNLLRGLYIESSPTYGILVDGPDGFNGRGGNTIIGIHFDGAVGTAIVDPQNELTVIYSGMVKFWKNTLVVDQANQMVGIGTDTPSYKLEVNGTAGKPGGGSWGDSSDERLKKNISKIDGLQALERISQLQGVTFDWVNPQQHAGAVTAGVVAQQLEAIFPEWVHEVEPIGSDKALIPKGQKSKSVSFPHAFNAYLIEAIKAQQTQIEALKEQQAQMETLKAEINALKTQLKVEP